MTRDIRFRAWDKDKKQMLYPRQVYAFPANYRHIFELMQYIELDDQDGKPIYEDDLLIHRYPAGSTIYKAVIGEKTYDVDGLDFGYYGVHFIYVSSTMNYVGDCVTGMKGSYPLVSELEIIGNIYQNPELLESLP